MHRPRKGSGVALWALLATLLCGEAGGKTVKTGDGLELRLSERGSIEGLSVDGASIPLSARGTHVPVAICDVTRGDVFVTAEGVSRPDEGGIRCDYDMAALSLHVGARYEAAGDVVRISLHVHDTSGRDRGLMVRFALPVAAEGWEWWDDLVTHRTIGTSGTYERSRGMREFAALPEWADRPALNMGRHAVNFCSVISGPSGLCLAVPLDQPRIFRTGYDADSRLFYIVYDAALAAQTDPPGSARFEFLLYRCDPDWGMRSALDRYYRTFPEHFTKHVDREGMWMAFSELSEIDNANEFRFAYQEGAPEPGYDNRLGVYSLTYFTHAGLFANIPGYDPEKDPEPSYEQQLATMREKFREQTGDGGIFDASGLYDETGKLSIKRTSVYGHIIAQYNLDPALPYGRYMLARTSEVFRRFREQRGGELDGFYYDGITTGINYRREHFQYAEYPPIWDPVNRLPFLYNYFSSVAFARAAADSLHRDGKITMMNGAMGSSFYTAPHLDVMGAETGLKIDRSELYYIRTICLTKPFVTLLKGDFNAMSGEDFERYMRQCVAFGVFPGVFDWMPSGLGPGSRYWEHPVWYERDRLNHRKYTALCQRLAAAGWEPLTQAISSDPEVVLERFGRTADGEVYLTVFSDAAMTRPVSVEVPLDAMPPGSLAVDLVAMRRVETDTRAGRLVIPVQVGGGSLAVLHLAPAQEVAKGQMNEVVRSLALSRQMSEMDRGRSARLVQWRAPRGGTYGYEGADAERRVKLSAGDGGAASAISQWVMLYQEQPEALRLRVRYRSGETARGATALRADAVLCHVNMKTRFTQHDRKSHPLPSSGGDTQDREVILTAQRPLRSIQLTVALPEGAGWATVERISVTPLGDPSREYAVDPDLRDWYIQPSEEVRARADTDLRALAALVQGGDARGIAAAQRQIEATRSWIVQGGLENPCRRVLRELDDAEMRLRLAASL